MSRRTLAPVVCSVFGFSLGQRLQLMDRRPADREIKVEINREPLAYFITRTVYGTFFSGRQSLVAQEEDGNAIATASTGGMASWSPAT